MVGTTGTQVFFFERTGYQRKYNRHKKRKEGKQVNSSCFCSAQEKSTYFRAEDTSGNVLSCFAQQKRIFFNYRSKQKRRKERKWVIEGAGQFELQVHKKALGSL